MAAPLMPYWYSRIEKCVPNNMYHTYNDDDKAIMAWPLGSRFDTKRLLTPQQDWMRHAKDHTNPEGWASHHARAQFLCLEEYEDGSVRSSFDMNQANPFDLLTSWAKYYTIHKIHAFFSPTFQMPGAGEYVGPDNLTLDAGS